MKNNKNLTLLIFFVLFLSLPSIGFAGDAADIVDALLAQFGNAAAQWVDPLKDAAEQILYILSAIVLVWNSIRLVLNQADLQEWVATLVQTIITIGLGVWLITNADTLVREVINGWLQVSATATGTNEFTSTGQILERGLKLFQEINDTADGLAQQIVHPIFGAIVVIIYALITASVFMIEIQAYFVSAAGIILLAFFGNPWMNQYARNYLQYWFSVGMKLYVVHLVVGAGDQFINDWASAQDYASSPSVVYLLAVVLVLLVLVWHIPAIIGGLITGASINTPTAGDIGRKAAGFAGGAIAGAAGGVMAVSEAAKLADSQPGSGFGSGSYKAANTLGNLASAAGHVVGGQIMGGYKASHGTFAGSMAQDLRAQRDSLGGGSPIDQAGDYAYRALGGTGDGRPELPGGNNSVGALAGAGGSGGGAGQGKFGTTKGSNGASGGEPGTRGGNSGNPPVGTKAWMEKQLAGAGGAGQEGAGSDDQAGELEPQNEMAGNSSDPVGVSQGGGQSELQNQEAGKGSIHGGSGSQANGNPLPQNRGGGGNAVPGGSAVGSVGAAKSDIGAAGSGDTGARNDTASSQNQDAGINLTGDDVNQPQPVSGAPSTGPVENMGRGNDLYPQQDESAPSQNDLDEYAAMMGFAPQDGTSSPAAPVGLGGGGSDVPAPATGAGGDAKFEPQQEYGGHGDPAPKGSPFEPAEVSASPTPIQIQGSPDLAISTLSPTNGDVRSGGDAVNSSGFLEQESPPAGSNPPPSSGSGDATSSGTDDSEKGGVSSSSYLNQEVEGGGLAVPLSDGTPTSPKGSRGEVAKANSNPNPGSVPSGSPAQGGGTMGDVLVTTTDNTSAPTQGGSSAQTPAAPVDPTTGGGVEPPDGGQPSYQDDRQRMQMEKLRNKLQTINRQANKPIPPNPKK